MLTRKNKRQRIEQELLEILDVVAGNGWFPWRGENADGSKDLIHFASYQKDSRN